MTHPLQWTAPPPFWRTGEAARTVPGLIAQPQILRFATDDFMDEVLSTLAQHPQALPEYTAQAETWRAPHAGPKPNPAAWLERPPSRLLPLARQARAKAQALPAVALPQPLKLYQAAHQRHYLVAGSLVCQTPGLPDRAVDAGKQKVSFVLRRLFLKSELGATTGIDPRRALKQPDPAHMDEWVEHAWVLSGKSGHWQVAQGAEVATARIKLVKGEERLATFPTRYVDAQRQPRRLFIGSVPVGRRETYQSASRMDTAPTASEEAAHARTTQFRVDVLAPWRALVNTARTLADTPAPSIYAREAFDDKTGVLIDPSKIDPARLRHLRSQLQLSTWYALLDLRAWLAAHLPGYLDWLDAGEVGTPPGSSGVADFHALLQRVRQPDAMRTGPWPITDPDSAYATAELAVDLPDAIRRIGEFSEVLENALSGSTAYATTPFEIPAKLAVAGTAKPAHWPDFLFLLVDPLHEVPTPLNSTEAPPNSPDDFAAEQRQTRIEALAEHLPEADYSLLAKAPEPSLASLTPTDMREGWYVMRLVYERPDCAPFEGTVISAATVPFQMAGFFDPDAPARPIRIGLPVDISPAGLRKFDKNTVFMMSDMLCGHLDRFRGITFGDLVLSVLPWPFHKDFNVADKGPCKQQDMSLGVMCSLSIPIITICALILLTIIVSLLDFIFRWLPLFIVCFPLPGFKARKAP